MSDYNPEQEKLPVREVAYSLDNELASGKLDDLAGLDKESDFKITDGLPRVRMIFFRHGQHPEAANDPDPDLTGLGVKEAQDLGRRIRVNESQSVGFYIDNLRSLMSITRVMKPDLPESDMRISAQCLIDRHKIKTDSALNYKPVALTGFRKALDSAVDAGRVLRFLVEESDKCAGLDGATVSTYSSIAKEWAKIIKKYVSVERQWTKINRSSPYDDKNLYRLFCGREFVIACMRAKLTEKVLGMEERDNFVDWYEQSEENKEVGRSEYTIITIEPDKDDSRLILEDNFGRLTFGPKVLDELMYEPCSAIEPAAYVVPLRINSVSNQPEVALVLHDDGYGFVGGRLEGGEVPDEALRREIQEELGSVANHSCVVRVDDVYDFEMAKGNRPGKGKHREQHYFYVSLLASDQELSFQEPRAQIAWVPISALLDEDVIVHSELREYLRKSVMPVIENLIP